ncbi:universal stress protein [Halopenitus persicus]|uniref:Nucleotide-binding universal stress protein, UspA family n=1 Tax=Halopenitus persicus TaxID=1048396 RepID=A0A1H3FJJ4_9EURY|nr:universal stress protein [Halopenitus persicus]SDX91161.1 Nucleotide-binding universal stress protein, UspA family [Halopenitus persicus]
MARHILVPLDGSAASWNALEFAIDHHPEATITAVHVVSVVSETEATPVGMAPVHVEEVYEAAEEHAASLLSDAEELAAERGTDVETEHVRGRPTDAILDYVEAEDVDQIIMGSHGHSGLKRVVIGSVAERVTRHAPVPVTIVRADAETE